MTDSAKPRPTNSAPTSTGGSSSPKSDPWAGVPNAGKSNKPGPGSGPIWAVLAIVAILISVWAIQKTTRAGGNGSGDGLLEGDHGDRIRQLESQLSQANERIARLQGESGEKQKLLWDTVKKLTERMAAQEKVNAERWDMEAERLSLQIKEAQTAQSKKDTQQDDVISDTSKKLQNVETRVIYLEKRLPQLDELEIDLKNLQGDTSALKKEYLVLKNDLGNVRKKGKATAQELGSLEERTHLFQLKILQARAREASRAARKGDLEGLLEKLNDLPE